MSRKNKNRQNQPRQNQNQPRPNPQPNQPKQANQEKRPRPPLAYYLWRFSDPSMISSLSDSWVSSIAPSAALSYLVAFFFLSILFTALAWNLDLGPSYDFARHVASNAPTYATLKQVLILVGALTPTLLEFFAVGLALQGNLALDITIKLFVLFDAITDAPGAYTWGSAIASYFIPASYPSLLLFASWLFSAPMLFFATIVVETVALSLILTFFRLLKKSLTTDTEKHNPSNRPRPPHEPGNPTLAP